MKKAKNTLLNRLLALIMVLAMGIALFPAKMASADEGSTEYDTEIMTEEGTDSTEEGTEEETGTEEGTEEQGDTGEKTFTLSVVYSNDSASNVGANVTLNGVSGTEVTADCAKDVEISIAAPDGYYIDEAAIDNNGTILDSSFSGVGTSSLTGNIKVSEETTYVKLTVTLRPIYTITAYIDGMSGEVTLEDSLNKGVSSSETEDKKGTVYKIYGSESYSYNGVYYAFNANASEGYRVAGVTVYDVNSNADEPVYEEKFKDNDYSWSCTIGNNEVSEGVENFDISNYEITVVFAPNNYTITTSASGSVDEGCSVTAENNGAAVYTGSAEVTIAWENGYHVESVEVKDTSDNEVSYEVNDSDSTTEKIIKVSDIASDLTVNVVYAENPTVDGDSYTLAEALRSYESSSTTYEGSSTIYVYSADQTPTPLTLNADEYSKLCVNSTNVSAEGLEGETVVSALYFGYSTGETSVFGDVTYWTELKIDPTFTIAFDETEPEASVSVEGNSGSSNNKTYYSSDVTVTVTGYESEESYSGIESIVYWLDSEDRPEEVKTLYTNTGEDPSASVTSEAFTIENDNADHTLYVEVTDRAGNSSITTEEINFSRANVTVSINGTKSNEAANGYYYNSDRTVTITITERSLTFNEEGLTLTFNGKTVTSKKSDWNKTDEDSKKNLYKYTYTYTFTDEGKYDWDFTYKNRTNPGLSYSSSSLSSASVTGEDVFEFVIDKTAPGGYVSIDSVAFMNASREDGFYNSPLSTFSFAFFAKSINTATATTTDWAENDSVSGINTDKTLYYKTDQTTALTVDDLEALYKDGNFETELYWTNIKNETFVVYARIVDNAGNVTYISSDGAILDNTAPTVEVGVAPESEEEIYTSDVTLEVVVEDPAANNSCSGIADVVYWIEYNNGEKTEEQQFTAAASAENESTGLIAKLTGTIKVKSAEYNYSDVVVYVEAKDNAGNKTVSQYALDIDSTTPTITISYDNNDAANGSYFTGSRTATIEITKRTNHFSSDDVTIEITTVDAAGETVSNAYTLGEWVTTEGDSPDDATHTLTIEYPGDANYTFAISYTDDAGHEAETSNTGDPVAPYEFTVDNTAPTGSVTIDNDATWVDKLLSIITFGIISSDSVSVEIEGVDETSPITLAYYVQKQTEGALDGMVMSKGALDALAESTWTTVTNTDNLSALEASWTEKDDQFVVYVRVMDYAGNVTYIGSDGVISDTDSPSITLIPEDADVDNGKSNVYGYYNRSNDGTVSVDVEISDVDDNNSYSGLETVTYQVLCDGEVTQSGTLFSFDDDVTSEDPTYAQLAANNTWSGTISVSAAENNSCNVEVIVTAVDQAGNESSSSVNLDIDVTAPTIAISYDNNSAKNSSYFADTRTATIVITERTSHFDADDVEITITAVDADGDKVSEATVSSMLSSWTTVEGSTADAATHTATITYSKDANYTFAISYTDKAGNTAGTASTGSSVTPYEFTVDTTAPIGTVTYTSAEGSSETKSSLVRTLTFGFYSSSKITVTGTSDDETSPIASVQYYKTSSTTAMTTSQLDALSSTGWTTFSGISVTSDEQFTVYLKITDYAGNYTYISTDGLIVDESRPVAENFAPEITLTQPINGIYNGDVTVDVTVKDPSTGGTYSGLKSVTYEVYSLGALTQSGTLYTFSNLSPTQSQLTQSISDVIKVLSSLNNSNDVEIIVYAEDNAGNTSQQSVTCMIDTTAPTISVSYDNNSPDSSNSTYFKENRTATITIAERNFDAGDVVVTITNTDGTIPTISGWTKHAGSGNEDNTTWTATIVYSADGDYTFGISYTDEAGNAASAVSYAAGTAAGEAFTIDKTIPTISVVYNNNDVLNGNYYKASRTATITITEHNFDAGRVVITATSNGASMAVNPAWSTSGDVHTATVTFPDDELYTFDIAFTDMAGNNAADYAQNTFYVDLTNPEITISGVANESANTGTVMPTVTVTDANYDSTAVSISLVAQRYGYEYTYTTEDITNGQSFSYENIEEDDIYVLTVTAKDKAGNESSDSIRFSVNRNGSTYDISNLESINGEYLTAENMTDLVIHEVNPNRLTEIVITLYKNSETITLVEGEDYEVSYVVGENGWYEYTYTIYKEVFEDDGIYNIRISSVDEAENTSANTLDTKSSDIEFVVDNTRPVTVVTNLESDMIVNASSYTVSMSVSDNLSLALIEVYIDGELWKTFTSEEIQEILNANDVFTFDIEENTSARTITIVAADAAGNTDEVTYTNVLITTNAWVRFYSNTPLLVGTVVGIVLAIALILFLILFFKRRKKDEEEQVAK